MAELRSLFLEIYIFILCVNAGIFVLDSVDPDTSLISPFTQSAIISNSTGTYTVVDGVETLVVEEINIYDDADTSGSLVGDVSINVVNGTGSSDVLQPIQDSLFFPFAIFETFINFLTGGFIWQVMAIFGMNQAFVIGMQSIIGFLLVLTIIYYFTGR